MPNRTSIDQLVEGVVSANEGSGTGKLSTNGKRESRRDAAGVYKVHKLYLPLDDRDIRMNGWIFKN